MAQTWNNLLAQPGPIMADGAMGTMLFESGLQFGDPPEVWNVTHPDVIRGIEHAARHWDRRLARYECGGRKRRCMVLRHELANAPAQLFGITSH